MTESSNNLDHKTPPSDYPADHVVAVLDTQGELEATMKALIASGFLESEIDASWGPEAAAALGDGTGRGGFTGAVMWLADRLGLTNEEMRIKQQYEDALGDGRIVIAVSAPTDERKDRASALLQANGAQHVMFLGKFTMTSLSPSTSG